MADLIPAAAGDKLTEKARRVLAFALGHRLAKGDSIPEDVPETVKPKADGNDGQWFDIDDGYLARHNFDAHSHAESHTKHRWAWRNFGTGDLEAP